jgi:predicted lactoylglutathione lyase
MVALAAKDKDQVQRFYDTGHNGGPVRDLLTTWRDYAAYFRDPDGNKLNAFAIKGLMPADRV